MVRQKPQHAGFVCGVQVTVHYTGYLLRGICLAVTGVDNYRNMP